MRNSLIRRAAWAAVGLATLALSACALDPLGDLDPALTPGASSVEPSLSDAAAPAADEFAVIATDPQVALLMAEQLVVAPRDPHNDYDRTDFGFREFDVDGNGCDTRDDVLARDLVDIEIRPNTGGCVVASGTLYDPYSGDAIDFVRGPQTSEAVQIDHVVALYNAWRMGAQDWDDQLLIEFGNDPLNLLAVGGAENDEKGHSDASQWLPSNTEFHCEYAGLQVAIKTKYQLWVTQYERDALMGILQDC